MPRKPAFTPASLYVHFQPVMARAYPVLDGIPGTMQDCLAQLAQLAQPSDGSVAARLAGLKRLVDDELHRPIRAN